MLSIPVCALLRKKAGHELGHQVVALSMCVFLICFHTECLLFAQDNPEARLNVEQWQKRMSPTADDLTSTLDELQQHSEIINRVLPELAIVLVRGNESAQKLAVRCLEHAESLPAPTLNLLISFLDHPDYTFRIEVAFTLRKLGPVVVPKLQEALASKSPRIRSNALSILNHLITVDAATLDELQRDPDERVRVCVARSWLKHGKLGIAKIGELTMDESPAVAVAAVSVLQYNYTDPETAVSFLRKSVRRPEAFEESVLALESQGVAAVAAIPDMVAALHENELPRDVHRGFESIVHDALVHIGPARLEDLPRLQPLLSIPHPITQELAAELIGRFGLEAKSAAADLEKACLSIVFEDQRLRQQESQIPDEDERREFSEMNSRYRSAYEQTCFSFWLVTHDMPKMKRLLEQIVTITQEPMYFFEPEIEQATPADAKLLLAWLDSKDPNLAETASSLGRLLPISSLNIDELEKLRASEPFRWWTFEKLASTPQDQELHARLVNWMLEEYHADRLSISDLVRVVEKQRLRAPELLSVLHSEIRDGDEITRRSCLLALARLEGADSRHTQLIINNLSEPPLLRREALEIFLSQEIASEAQIQFATESLSSSDPDIVASAITLLAKAGPAAVSSLEAIKSVRSPTEESDKSQLISRLRLIAICSISNDKTAYQAELDQLFHVSSDGKNHAPLQHLAQLGSRCEFFLPEIEKILSAYSADSIDRTFASTFVLECLTNIDNARARELLTPFENHRDYRIRRYVKHLLRSRETGTKEYFDWEDY